MNKSQSVEKLAPALLRAQKKIGAASKDAANPFFKSKYADLGAVMEACKEALNAEGIFVLQPASSDPSGHYVETILFHESGEFISDRMKLELKASDMQQLGSAITYARRYGLQSMLFIPAEDDDAEKTMNREVPVTNKPTTTSAAAAAKPTEAPKPSVRANGAAPAATPGGWA